ncbi:hypothetical protein BGX38DRAFT_1147295 [Terfezia claveryi]|nr:hypothetical protein BGX38DRAFT_1147295 [Terfezia claveryi]
MPSETGKSGKDVQGASGDRWRHGRQQNISVSGRHYSAVRSQKILVRHRMPSETGSRAGCPQRQESQERTYKVPRETDGRHGRQQNISVSGRHYSTIRSQKILGKAWDAPETGRQEVGKVRTGCLGRQEVE